MNMIMKSAACATVALLLAATGCAKETTAKTEADVTRAEAAGARDVAAVRNDATNTMADAQMKVFNTQEELAHKAAETNQSMAIAEAQASHKVAIERCEAQDGDARAACKKLVDVELTDATARADAEKAADYPNG